MTGPSQAGRIEGVSQSWWPILGLRLRTPRLELRLPSDADLQELADVAARGVHDPDVQPFTVPWTDAAPEDRARATMLYHWAQRGAWKPENWSLDLVVLRDGEVVGTQGVGAVDFAVTRQVGSGSWLGIEYHGQGIGTQMRAAVLELAFAGLGARYATSAAFEDSLASRAVSRKLGYLEDGVELHASRGRPATTYRYRLDRESWERHRAVPVTIEGLEPCLPLFGLGGERGQRP